MNNFKDLMKKKEKDEYIYRSLVEIVYSESVNWRLRWANRLLKMMKQNYTLKK